MPKVGAALGTPPRDAKFKTSGGHVTIVPSKDGVGPDVVDFAANLTDRAQDRAANPRAPWRCDQRSRRPSSRPQQARDMGVHERISTFTTTYDGSNRPRTNNIHTLGCGARRQARAARAVRSRSTSTWASGRRPRAIKRPPAIVKGKLVPQLGGGICQVGTTLFNTVFFSGMPIAERENHSFYISHYPKGRDATVSWGGPDLKWKNTTSIVDARLGVLLERLDHHLALRSRPRVRCHLHDRRLHQCRPVPDARRSRTRRCRMG